MNGSLAIITALVTSIGVALEHWPIVTFGVLLTLILSAEIAGGND